MAPRPNPVANPTCVLREDFDEWAVVFNPDTATAVGLNAVGVAIWKLLDGAHSVQAIAEAIGLEFDGVPGAVLEHVEGFVDDLEQRGFLGRAAGETGTGA